MRKIYTFLICSMLFSLCSFAQSYNGQEPEVVMAELIRSQFNQSIFTAPEIQYGINDTMEDFIPTAGATETFEPVTGDWFYDTGGPGGSTYPDYDNPGDYESCSCTTSTTLAGVTELKFHSFGVFTTFDYLKIYDGADASGTLLFDNGSGGMNENAMTLDDLIASHGSDTFTGTSGNFYFEFYATGVVAYSGWDVEIITAGDGTGCTTPTLSVETPDPICEGTTATITADSNGDEVNWYDSESSTSPIHNGLVFETPELAENTSYWVQAFNQSAGEGEIIEGGARLAPASNSHSDVVPATSPWGLSFDATESFTITSVDVYLASSTPGDLVMQLLDENYNVLDESTISCPAGSSSSPVQFEVPLDFTVEAGNTYKLVAASSPEMVREFSSEHPGFPYPIGDVGSVTGGTINNSNTNNTVYYFFYNWTVQTGDIQICESDRIQVDVTVNPVPEAPTGDADQFFTIGETLADLEVTADGDLTWYADEGGTIVLDENTLLIDGTTYYVSQNTGGCESGLLAITVHLQLGVNDLDNNLFTVYPNPVKDVLNIVGKTDISSVEIYDLAGRNIQTIQELNQNKIDFSRFSSGTYMLKIVADQTIEYIKVIKK